MPGRLTGRYTPLAVAVAGVMLFSPFGLAVMLLTAGCAGVALFHSWRSSAALLLVVLALAGAYAAEGFIVGTALPDPSPGPRSAAGPSAGRSGEISPRIDGHEIFIQIHNDAVVQGLSEVPNMADVSHWGVMTLGTGLGNARFTNRTDT
jgi:hypothetical protein